MLQCSYGLRPFEAESWVTHCVQALRASANKYAFLVYAYCFMPDHLHLLVDNESGADLVQFMRYFKQLTGYPYKREHGAELWQRRFYDRALRRDETLDRVVAYIFDNPVVAGLVDEPQQYQYSGSFVWPEVLSRS